MVRSIAVAALVSLGALASCTHSARARDVPDATLIAANDEPVAARALAARAPFTVFFFYSEHCPCVAAHDGRVRALYERCHARGVDFVAVDSEVGATAARDAQSAKTHGYPFPILIDRGAALANALGAEYASYTVVVDAKGRVRYAGGVDSDKTHLRDDATMFVSDALDDLLAGREPRIAEGKTLGCALQTW